MFIIKFKDGTEAKVYDILSTDGNSSTIMFWLEDINIYCWIERIDKIVRVYE